MVAAAARVNDHAQQGRSIKCIQSTLYRFLLTDAFADHDENSVRQLHPERGIRHRNYRRSVNDDPVEEFSEPVEQFREASALHQVEWVFWCAPSGKEPETGAIEFVHYFRKLPLASQTLAQSRQGTVEPESAG